MPDRRNTLFGNPSVKGGGPNAEWARNHLVQVTLPWPMRSAYNLKRAQQSVTFHRQGAEPLKAALNAVWAEACRRVKDTPEWAAARIEVKRKHGFQHTTEFYDEQMADFLRAQALELIQSFGGDINSGTYVYRTTRGSGSLSNHAYAIAIDINHQQNPMSSPLRTTFPDWYIKCWEDNGFTWGGRWQKRPDAMHFELKY
jgi:hypothetical protein